ncbi:hypothetical protein Ddc_00827 [Ditylenchus destructor]|nr:hypothetical protein Ddc_00827 [Ditylenchus destructor]
MNHERTSMHPLPFSVGFSILVLAAKKDRQQHFGRARAVQSACIGKMDVCVRLRKEWTPMRIRHAVVAAAPSIIHPPTSTMVPI